MQYLKKTVAILGIILFSSCSTSVEKTLNVGGVEVLYKSIHCESKVKMNGFDITIEGFDFPAEPTNPWKFNVGKFEYKQKTMEHIKNTVFYYDGLLEQTCKSMIMMSKGEAKNNYISNYTNLLNKLVIYLSTIEKLDDEEKIMELYEKTMKNNL